MASHSKWRFFTLAKVTHQRSTIMDKPLCTLLLLFSQGTGVNTENEAFITPVGGLQWWVKVCGLLMEGLVGRINCKTSPPPHPEPHGSSHLRTLLTQSFPFLATQPKSRLKKLSILIEIINPFYSSPDFHFCMMYYWRKRLLKAQYVQWAAAFRVSQRHKEMRLVASFLQEYLIKAECMLCGGDSCDRCNK